MTLGSLVLLTPAAGLVALVAVVPLAAAALAARRVRRARGLLRLPAAPSRRQGGRIIAIAAVPVLLGLAATQPVLSSTTNAKVRTDAQAFFVIDVSRSMKAARHPGAPTRLSRAVKAAIALRAGIPTVPSGIATLTDRTLPSLFPTSDESVFDRTMAQAISLEQPPPENQHVLATTLGAIGSLGTQNFFPPSAKHRLVVVLTDGESRPFDARQVARAFHTGPGVRVVFVHVAQKGEAVYDGSRPEQGYSESPESGQTLKSLASATGGSAFGERELAEAIRAEKADLGTGPTIVQGTARKTRVLAPYLALLSLVPLLVALVPVHRGARARARSPRPASADRSGEALGPAV